MSIMYIKCSLIADSCLQNSSALKKKKNQKRLDIVLAMIFIIPRVVSVSSWRKQAFFGPVYHNVFSHKLFMSHYRVFCLQTKLW